MGAFTARQHNGRRQVKLPREVVRPQDQKSAASVIAKQELFHRQDCCSSCKYDLRSVQVR